MLIPLGYPTKVQKSKTSPICTLKHSLIGSVLGTERKALFKAERLGRKIEDSKSRPVKVTMDNPVADSELLKKSRDLKNSTDHSAVYLKPDRTVKQRRKHRELVSELKQSIKDSPDKRHFIKNGEVCHEENVKMDKADVPAKSVSNGPGVTEKKEKPGKYYYRTTLRQTEDRHVAMYCQSQQTPQIVIDNFYVWPPRNNKLLLFLSVFRL